MIEAAHGEVTQLLSEHRSQLDSLARALLKAETLDASDAYAAALIQTDLNIPIAHSSDRIAG